LVKGAPWAPFTRAFGKKRAFKVETYLGAACLWHFTRAFGKKRAFKVEAYLDAACLWHFTLALGMEKAIHAEGGWGALGTSLH
jgi:hypothetical protein